MYSYGPPHMAEQKQDDQHEHTFNNYVRIRDVVEKTCQMRWTIGKSGERGSGISVLPARHDDDDVISIIGGSSISSFLVTWSLPKSSLRCNILCIYCWRGFPCFSEIILSYFLFYFTFFFFFFFFALLFAWWYLLLIFPGNSVFFFFYECVYFFPDWVVLILLMILFYLNS